MTDLPRRLTATLLFLLLLFCIYRARTQSLVIDEAWVFQRFVNQPLSEMARSWDACNHVLHTVLMKWFLDWFGMAEVVLRVPTLIGAALYLAAVYRLTDLLFGGWRQPVAAAALTLHPLLVDLLVAARGYGLALGLFAWSLYCATSYLIKGRRAGTLMWAGVSGGLAVAANLTFVVPVAALGLILLLSERSWQVVDSYAGPAFVIATMIVMIPLLQARGADFYFGEDSAFGTLRRMYDTTLKSEYARFTPFGWRLSSLAAPALSVLYVALSGVAIRLLVRGNQRNYRNAPAYLACGTLAMTGLILILLGAFGVPYPSGRTGLYLILLFTLSTLLVLRERRVGTVLGLIVAAIYVTENDPRFFNEWRFDAGTRELLRRFDEDRHRRGMSAPVSLAVAPHFKLTTQYYQLRRRMPWLKVEEQNALHASYVMFDSASASRAASPEFEIISKDALSGAVLARRVR